MLRTIGMRVVVLAIMLSVAQFAAGETTDDAEGAARAFFTKIGNSDLGDAYDSLIGPAAKDYVSKATFVQQMGVVHIQLGGSARDRRVVGRQDMDFYPAANRRGQFTYIRFRSSYPVGDIFEDATLERANGKWGVLKWYFLNATPQ